MTTRRILCMDRDESIRDLITTMPDLSDMEVVRVSDVDEALRMMKHERFSLYVIDGQMTSVSGLTLCEGFEK